MYYEAQEEVYIQEEEYMRSEREARELFEDDMRAEGELMEREGSL